MLRSYEQWGGDRVWRVSTKAEDPILAPWYLLLLGPLGPAFLSLHWIYVTDRKLVFNWNPSCASPSSTSRARSELCWDLIYHSYHVFSVQLIQWAHSPDCVITHIKIHQVWCLVQLLMSFQMFMIAMIDDWYDEYNIYIFSFQIFRYF